MNGLGQKTTLNILVNNSGAYYFGKLSENSEEDFGRVFSVNSKGALLVTKAGISQMADGGRIISISTRVAKRPGALDGAYAMTKAAIETMTLSLAAELGPRGIT
jgi:3-oxoacyl-[acyl-carrier protein] reductase